MTKRYSINELNRIFGEFGLSDAEERARLRRLGQMVNFPPGSDVEWQQFNRFTDTSSPDAWDNEDAELARDT